MISRNNTEKQNLHPKWKNDLLPENWQLSSWEIDLWKKDSDWKTTIFYHGELLNFPVFFFSESSSLEPWNILWQLVSHHGLRSDSSAFRIVLVAGFDPIGMWRLDAFTPWKWKTLRTLKNAMVNSALIVADESLIFFDLAKQGTDFPAKSSRSI